LAPLKPLGASYLGNLLTLACREGHVLLVIESTARIAKFTNGSGGSEAVSSVFEYIVALDP
jgi:hypothetical protein